MNVFFILAGIAGGLIAGMGMGGGTLTIPILTLALDVEQKTAQAVNLISFVVMSVPVLAIHIKNGLVDLPSFLKTAPLAAAGSAVCAWFAPDIPAEVLSRCFGGFLIALGVWQGASAIKSKVKKDKGFSPQMSPLYLVDCQVLCSSDKAYYPKKFDTRN